MGFLLVWIISSHSKAKNKIIALFKEKWPTRILYVPFESLRKKSNANFYLHRVECASSKLFPGSRGQSRAIYRIIRPHVLPLVSLYIRIPSLKSLRRIFQLSIYLRVSLHCNRALFSTAIFIIIVIGKHHTSAYSDQLLIGWTDCLSQSFRPFGCIWLARSPLFSSSSRRWVGAAVSPVWHVPSQILHGVKLDPPFFTKLKNIPSSIPCNRFYVSA